MKVEFRSDFRVKFRIEYDWGQPVARAYIGDHLITECSGNYIPAEGRLEKELYKYFRRFKREERAAEAQKLRVAARRKR